MMSLYDELLPFLLPTPDMTPSPSPRQVRSAVPVRSPAVGELVNSSGVTGTFQRSYLGYSLTGWDTLGSYDARRVEVVINQEVILIMDLELNSQIQFGDVIGVCRGIISGMPIIVLEKISFWERILLWLRGEGGRGKIGGRERKVFELRDSEDSGAETHAIIKLFDGTKTIVVDFGLYIQNGGHVAAKCEEDLRRVFSNAAFHRSQDAAGLRRDALLMAFLGIA